ncbi:MAG: hypothetical protein BWY97_01527 [Tenericutes bacterium ADurb.BinA124]|nr:MAG: hypothetical protein BWY97_01527 [Tenericutes bacterium ADurb.BinA124]
MNFGDIERNSTKWYQYESYYVIQFTVSNTAPANTQIPFNISITDGNGNSFTDSFNVTVSATGATVSYNSYNIYSDNNGDDIINKGETIRMNVSLKNNGTSTAKSVKATFSSTSQYISNLTPTTQISYGDISANSVKWYQYESYYVIQFTVSNITPANTKIPINISISDESGNTWTDKFEITISATGANITYNSFNIYSDNNSDGIINKGETVRLNLSLKNTGTSIARAVKATFSTSSSYVSNLTPTTQVSYGDISANSVKWYQYESYYVIQFTVSSNTPANTTIPFSISIVDESGNTWSTNFNVTVSATGANVSYNSYNVYSDNNNNGIVNKGETVRLNVSLKNTGTSTANSVKSTFSTTSSYISNFTPTTQITYGNISANSVKWYQYESYYVIQFTVSGSTPANTQIPISISIVDESNNTWSSSFNVTVQ